jgi:hypothetical protein
MIKYKIKKYSLLITLISLIFCTSCMPSFNIRKNAEINFKNKSIAVLAATRDNETVLICNAINNELSKQTNFKVLDNTEIKKLIPQYPLKVKGPYDFAFKSIADNYKLTDLERVKEIQGKLKTDYILFLWCPSRFVDEKGTYYIIMQGFSKSQKDYFASGKYRINHSGKQLILGAPDSFKDMVNDFSKKFAKSVGKKTGTLKK